MKIPYPLILASTSKYRAELLAKLGWTFSSEDPGVDEQPIKLLELEPVEIALQLSRLKSAAVFARNPSSCVIGSDQVCAIGKTIYSKPLSEDRAVAQLQEMNGKTHELLTAVTVTWPGGQTSFVNTTRLHMRELTVQEITQYVIQDRPLHCAGSYKLEERGIKLFERIEMDDHTAIIGLPLIELTNVLMELGYPF
ncbi:MAG: Maf family protein [Bacteriovoracaceae bacterium]